MVKYIQKYATYNFGFQLDGRYPIPNIKQICVESVSDYAAPQEHLCKWSTDHEVPGSGLIMIKHTYLKI